MRSAMHDARQSQQWTCLAPRSPSSSSCSLLLSARGRFARSVEEDGGSCACIRADLVATADERSRLQRLQPSHRRRARCRHQADSPRLVLLDRHHEVSATLLSVTRRCLLLARDSTHDAPSPLLTHRTGKYIVLNSSCQRPGSPYSAPSQPQSLDAWCYDLCWNDNGCLAWQLQESAGIECFLFGVKPIGTASDANYASGTCSILVVGK